MYQDQNKDGKPTLVYPSNKQEEQESFTLGTKNQERLLKVSAKLPKQKTQVIHRRNRR